MHFVSKDKFDKLLSECFKNKIDFIITQNIKDAKNYEGIIYAHRQFTFCKCKVVYLVINNEEAIQGCT